ncbi:hypothetical protein [Aliikangiella sp. IMCC44359]|uniref:hypothetical protein n=1 Tax=Aliikangiella sp. IMCC44359 TaxID=3459125 RepID=UPI00403AE568
MIRKIKVKAEKMEFICDECKAGVMRLIKAAPVVKANKTQPKLYRHYCTNCKCEAQFSVIYPAILYRESPFLMADLLKQASKESILKL